MVKKLYIYLSFIIIGVILTGCSSSGSISTYTIGVNTMPKNLDPQITENTNDILVLTNIYDGLFEIIDHEIVPNMVTDYTVSSDGTVYTFNLRQDSYYSYKDSKSATVKYDKTPVTAHDFVFAFQRILMPNTKSPYATTFLNIKNAQSVYDGASADILGVKALNDYTLQITLTSPDYNFIQTLSLSAVYPCNKQFFESTQGAYGLTTSSILSNGPFRLSYLSNEEGAATLIRVRDDKKNSLQRIRLRLIPQGEESLNFENDRISSFFEYATSNKTYSNSSVTSLASATSALVFNTNNPDLANEKIRQALSWYAYAYQNSGANLPAVSPSQSIFPDIMSFNGKQLNESLTQTTPNYLNNNPKDLLSQGLAESELQKLSGLTVLIPNDSKFSVIYENINQLWQKELSLFFSIEFLPTTQIMERVANNDYDIAFTLLNPTYDNPTSLLDNYVGIYPALDHNIALIKSSTNANNALSYITQCQNIVIENAIVTPIGKEFTTFYYKKYFTNISVNPFGHILNLKYTTSS